jgi:hypothetical protein
MAMTCTAGLTGDGGAVPGSGSALTGHTGRIDACTGLGNRLAVACQRDGTEGLPRAGQGRRSSLNPVHRCGAHRPRRPPVPAAPRRDLAWATRITAAITRIQALAPADQPEPSQPPGKEIHGPMEPRPPGATAGTPGTPGRF